MWFVSNGIIECHIENLQIEIGNRTPNCLRHHVWLDVSTFNKCLFTTKQRGFLLILICETSQIFVWRNKAFIFFQKSDIIQSTRWRTHPHEDGNICGQVSCAPPHCGERPSGNDNTVSQGEVKDHPSPATKTCVPPGGDDYRAK